MGAGSTERLLPAGAPLAVQWGLRGRGLLPPHRATDSQPPHLETNAGSPAQWQRR